MNSTTGYECWRKIAQFYDPPGGDGELDKINGLLNITRCTNLAKVPCAVETWEKDWNLYSEKTKDVLPEKWKVNLLLKMIPKDFGRDTCLWYVHDARSIQYQRLREQVFHYITTNAEKQDIDLLKKGVGRGNQPKFTGACNYASSKATRPERTVRTSVAD